MAVGGEEEGRDVGLDYEVAELGDSLVVVVAFGDGGWGDGRVLLFLIFVFFVRAEVCGFPVVEDILYFLHSAEESDSMAFVTHGWFEDPPISICWLFGFVALP